MRTGCPLRVDVTVMSLRLRKLRGMVANGREGRAGKIPPYPDHLLRAPNLVNPLPNGVSPFPVHSILPPSLVALESEHKGALSLGTGRDTGYLS